MQNRRTLNSWVVNSPPTNPLDRDLSQLLMDSVSIAALRILVSAAPMTTSIATRVVTAMRGSVMAAAIVGPS